MIGQLAVVLFDGFAFGMLLFILSVGLSVTLGLMNFVNLAHCAFGMLGGYITVTAMRQLGLPFLATLPLAFLGAAIGKALVDRGLAPPETKIFAQGELTHPEALESMGETAKGIITTYHYTLERDDPLNKEFVEAYREANDGRSPDLFSIGGYDGMHLIYEVLKKTNGDATGNALVEAAKGMSWESPRGPMSIDPETRDVIQTVYIREVQEVDGKLQNVIIHEIPDVKDPLHGAPK